MKRVDAILNNEEYRQYYKILSDLERERIFCRHNMEHFLDVARLAWIFNLEESLQIPKDILYATALLHDIGRHEQYLNGTPHEIASAELAKGILLKSEYQPSEIVLILDAIRNHRTTGVSAQKNLNGIIYRADKLSRACFSCSANKECNWDSHKKNNTLSY